MDPDMRMPWPLSSMDVAIAIDMTSSRSIASARAIDPRARGRWFEMQY
jgi:hypothetical protein